MDARLLARGLRARPTPGLLSSRQQQRFFPSTIRYNSSDSSSRNTSNQNPTEAAEPAKPSNAEQPSPKANTNTGSDFDEILNQLNLGSRNQPKSENPGGGSRKGRVSDSLSRDLGFKEQSAQLANRKTELKLGPTLGRQVHVEPERGIDLAAAIRKLQMTINSDKIKVQSFDQKYHMRKGMRRKLLRRMRWRKLFRFSFQETVKKIQRMQAQGW
jgi:hypothetical protein